VSTSCVVFQVNSTVTGVGATISGVTIENGLNTASSGGGISNYGTLAVTDSSLVNNVGALGDGGGIYNNGTMTVSNSSLVNNESSSGGGGIFNDTGGTMTVSNSSLSGNESVRTGRRHRQPRHANGDRQHIVGEYIGVGGRGRRDRQRRHPDHEQ
jgi:hypothetical protein